MPSKRYTDEEFIVAVEKSTSIRQVLIKLDLSPKGGSYRTVHRKVKELDLDISHFTGQGWNTAKGLKNPHYISAFEYLGTDKEISSHELRIKLYKENILEEKCSLCGLGPEWQGKSITLQLDHINGCSSDNRLENLRIVCPNCHSQTPTFRGRNITPKLSSGLPSALSVKGSPNLITDSQYVSNTVDPKDKSKFFCDCGKEKVKNAKTCLTCSYQNLERIVWPSKEELEVLVWLKPRSTLAKELGVSDKAIARRCSKFNISQPPRGYWTKLRALDLPHK